MNDLVPSKTLVSASSHLLPGKTIKTRGKTYTRDQVLTVIITLFESVLNETHNADTLSLAANGAMTRLLDNGIEEETANNIMAWLCRRIEKSRKKHWMVRCGMF